MVGAIGWMVLFAAFVVWEGLALSLRGEQWLSISDTLDAVTRPVAGRWLLLTLWLWVGWHLFVRGWTVFLRGSGDHTPPRAPPGSVGAWLREVFVPLAVLYAILLGTVAAGVRHRARPARQPTAEMPARRLAGHVVATISAGYLLFVTAIGLYTLIAGPAGAGMLGSALRGGGFLAFAVAAPGFVLLSALEAVVGHRQRGP